MLCRKVAEGLQLNELFLDNSESVMYQLHAAYPTFISLSFTRISINLLRLTDVPNSIQNFLSNREVDLLEVSTLTNWHTVVI